MIGIKYEMERINEQINCKLIKPLQQITQHYFDLNYYTLSHQILHTAQMLVDRLETNADIKAEYQKLVKKMKQSVKYRPENESQADQDQFDQKDEIRTFLNTRKPILETKQKERGDLYKFLASREKKEKDNETFLINMNKVKTMPHPKQAFYKPDTKTISVQTQITWTTDISLIPTQNPAINIEQVRNQIQNWFTGMKGSQVASRPKVKYEENIYVGQQKSSNKKQKQKKSQLSSPSKKLIGGKSKKNIEDGEEKIKNEVQETMEQNKKSQTKRMVKEKVSKLKKSKGTTKKIIELDQTSLKESIIERSNPGLMNKEMENGRSIPVSSQLIDFTEKEKQVEQGYGLEKSNRYVKNVNFYNESSNMRVVDGKASQKHIEQRKDSQKQIQLSHFDQHDGREWKQKKTSNNLTQKNGEKKSPIKNNSIGNSKVEQAADSLSSEKAGQIKKVNREATRFDLTNLDKNQNSKSFESPAKVKKEAKRNYQKQVKLNGKQQNANLKPANDIFDNYNENINSQEKNTKKKSIYNLDTQSKVSPKRRLNHSSYKLEKDKQNSLPQISANQKNTIFRETNQRFKSTIRNLKNINNPNNSYHLESVKEERKSYLNYSGHQPYERQPELDGIRYKVQQLLSKQKIGKKQLSEHERCIIEKLESIKQNILNNPHAMKTINEHQESQIQVCVRMFEALHGKVCGKGCRHLERFYTNIRALKTQGKKQLKLPIFLIDSNNIL